MATTDELSMPLLVNGDPRDDGAQGPTKVVSLPAQQRVTSLDIVRGLTVVIMILVNNGPQTPPPVYWAHAEWDGLALADVVMPFFLFMVGMSIVLAFARTRPELASDRARPGAVVSGRIAHVRRVLVRTVKLFLLGLLCQGVRSVGLPWPYTDLAILRIMGVLQRIALVYVVTALAFLFVPAIKHTASDQPWYRLLAVMVEYLPLWLVGSVFAVVYNGIMFGVLVPSRPGTKCDVRGDLTLACNAADYVDSLVLGPKHMYLPDIPHEPEGLTSSLSAVGSAFAGLYFGLVLRRARTWHVRVQQWTAASALLVGLGVLIATTSAVHVNKQLYTVSYMLLTSGMAGFVFVLVYLTADVYSGRWMQWLYFPFMCVGMNAIILYVADSVLWQMVRLLYYEEPQNNLYDWLRSCMVHAFPPEQENSGLMLWAFFDAALWTAVAIILWWRGVFFKV